MIEWAISLRWPFRWKLQRVIKLEGASEKLILPDIILLFMLVVTVYSV